MLVTRLELQNVKSYSDQVVTFTEGTNAICGENGAGKSTLLQAIGFALFDYLPYTQAEFVREGEKTATVTVSIWSTEDGREYQVVRRCGSSSDYYAYDPEIGAKLVSGKADMIDWLKEQMAVDSDADLPALFRDAIGVPQGLLTAPFLQTPSQRKAVFDPLLRVDEYNRAWNSLRDTTRHLRDRIADGEKQIAGLEAQVERLPDLRQKVETLRADLSGLEERLEALQTELHEATAHLRSLEAVKENLDKLSEQVNTLTTRLQGLDEQIEKAERGVAEAEAAQEVVEASRAGHEAYEGAQKALASLEEDRQQRDELQAELASQEKALALVQERLKGFTAALAEIEEAELQIEALGPQMERQEELEAALKKAQEQVRTLEAAQAQAAERQARLEDLQSRLQSLEAELSQAQQIEDQLDQTRSQLEKARQTIGDLRAEQAGLAAEMSRLEEQTQTLKVTEAAQCPVCEQALTAEHRSNLLKRNQAQLDELQLRNEALSSDISQAAERGSTLEQEVTNLEGQLRDLPRLADRDDLVAQIDELSKELTAQQAEIQDLAGSDEEASRLEGELGKLNDPLRQVERLSEKVRQWPEIEEKLEAERHAMDALEASLAEVQQGLAPFAGLDQKLAEQRSLRDQHEDDHERYLKNVEVAADLPQRRQELKALGSQREDLAGERDKAQAKADQIAARFDAQALDEARGREAGLKSEQARLEGQLDRLRQELLEDESEIESLEAIEEQLAAERESLANHRVLLKLTEFIRGVIRDAGPHVTRRLVHQVALEAGRLFADVMTDHRARLRWQDDYGILLERNGRDRGFQQLSGGEQMAAALAVRLALLRELSSINIAFFDEPTSNLDDLRRDSLAEQILSVKGFGQLFVISHDDTFERVTSNIIRVHKHDGVSQVEQQG